jgi:hypothetical protein
MAVKPCSKPMAVKPNLKHMAVKPSSEPRLISSREAVVKIGLVFRFSTAGKMF